MIGVDAIESSLTTRERVLSFELLWRYGGVVVHEDAIDLLRSLDPILRGLDAFFAYEPDGLVSHKIMGAVSHYPFVGRIVERFRRALPSGNARLALGMAIDGPTFSAAITDEAESQARVVGLTQSPVRIFASHIFFPADPSSMLAYARSTKEQATGWLTALWTFIKSIVGAEDVLLRPAHTRRAFGQSASSSASTSYTISTSITITTSILFSVTGSSTPSQSATFSCSGSSSVTMTPSGTETSSESTAHSSGSPTQGTTQTQSLSTAASPSPSVAPSASSEYSSSVSATPSATMTPSQTPSFVPPPKPLPPQPKGPATAALAVGLGIGIPATLVLLGVGSLLAVSFATGVPALALLVRATRTLRCLPRVREWPAASSASVPAASTARVVALSGGGSTYAAIGAGI